MKTPKDGPACACDNATGDCRMLAKSGPETASPTATHTQGAVFDWAVNPVGVSTWELSEKEGTFGVAQEALSMGQLGWKLQRLRLPAKLAHMGMHGLNILVLLAI